MLLEAAAALAPPDMTIRMSDHLSALPHFNPDLDGTEAPPAVVQWRAAVDDAEGFRSSRRPSTRTVCRARSRTGSTGW